jgi:hypothetical protein
MRCTRVRRLALHGLPRRPFVQLLDQHFAALDQGQTLTARCLEWRLAVLLLVSYQPCSHTMRHTAAFT